MSSTPNLTDPNHEFDKKNNYKRVTFQQGKPILDVDLNDLSLALENQTNNILIEKLGFGPPQLDYREFAIRSVDSNPVSSRNNLNIAITLGRLNTRKGVVDTRSLISADPSKEASIIFDFDRIQNGFSISEPQDNEFANYILKGKVSSATASKIGDTSKDFGLNLGLFGFDRTEYITPKYANNEVSPVNDLATPSPNACAVQLQEDPCRIVFVGNITPSLQGVSRNLISATGSVLDLDVSTPLPATPQAGDEYYIVPGNTLEDYKSIYDNIHDPNLTQIIGLTGLPELMPYIQVFEEDVNSSEDPNIQSSLLGAETTHRTQLRWCLRIAKVRLSSDTDTNGNDQLESPKLSHIFSLFSLINEFQYQALLDSVDADASLDAGLFQTSLWKEFNSDGSVVSSPYLRDKESPFSSLGLSPLHLMGNKENSFDHLKWALLKACLLLTLDNNSGFNDVQILALFNPSSKTTNDPANETLSPLIFPNKRPNFTTPYEHSFISSNASFTEEGSVPGRFSTPIKKFMSETEMGLDVLKSRSLFGLRNNYIIGNVAPLVFADQSQHLAYLDNIVLGMSGIGSALGHSLGDDSQDGRIPTAVDYTLPNTNSSVSQSGYGIGAVKPITQISGQTPSGFPSGSNSYLLREKGSRANHIVSWFDEELGWSFYKDELDAYDDVNQKTDLRVRGFEEGIAQAIAFEKGLNFRKLAIKTTAHKSMDLFTISERPPNKEVLTRILGNDPSNVSFMFPATHDIRKQLALDSYSGAGSIDQGASRSAQLFVPTSNSTLDLPALINPLRDNLFSITSKGFSQSNYLDLSYYYGTWNRFDAEVIKDLSSGVEDAKVPLDTWANRCTSMRLRYHVGDYYPGVQNSNGVFANKLVDSLNLFVRVEPLSLTHWMTMPKHQHSILENSFSMAEGIEALLKVSHGLGDTQKLINGSNQPLVQATSPVHTEGLPDYDTQGYLTKDVGEVDPLDLPFDHHAHPFVHWYHPAQHLIKAPHPSGDRYTTGERYTVYPKFGRRSLIIPALVPFEGLGDSATAYDNPTTVGDLLDNRDTNSFHDSSNSTLEVIVGGQNAYNSQGNGTFLDRSVFPYLPHMTRSTDVDNNVEGTTVIESAGNVNFTINENSFYFPHVPQSNEDTVPGPVFIPASRQYAEQTSDAQSGRADVGFYKPYIDSNPYANFPNDMTQLDGETFPYTEAFTYYNSPDDSVQGIGPDYLVKRQKIIDSFDAWQVPVLRAGIRTTTVAAVVDLVRTSFETGLASTDLNDYDFVMPSYTHATSGHSVQVPGIGPDSPVDTLFMGDFGTAIGGRTVRAGFMNPLNLGMGAYLYNTGLTHDSSTGTLVRDSFEFSRLNMITNSQDALLRVFTAINRQGLQQKLLWNCSFRILHHRPNGGDRTHAQSISSTAPKSLTELFLAHDRTTSPMTNMPFTGSPNHPNKKPYINLMAMHPEAQSQSPSIPGASKFSHLSNMVSDSIGGTHSQAAYQTYDRGDIEYRQDMSEVQTSSMGDTFGVDPFDYAFGQAYLGGNNPIRAFETANRNSGIEIELLSELDRLHSNATALNLNQSADLNGTSFSLIDTIPTSAELTQPGDHEIVFVLYTGHYGLKLHDSSDEISVDNIPSVAGCHLTATLELNRPSEKTDSTTDNNIHYGMDNNGEPIRTYSILSSRE